MNERTYIKALVGRVGAKDQQESQRRDQKGMGGGGDAHLGGHYASSRRPGQQKVQQRDRRGPPENGQDGIANVSQNGRRRKGLDVVPVVIGRMPVVDIVRCLWIAVEETGRSGSRWKKRSLQG